MTFDWFGLAVLVLMMIPNIIYFQKQKNNDTEVTHESGFREHAYRLKRQNSPEPGRETVRQSTSVEIVESIGRYGCIFLSVIGTGIYEYDFNTEITEILRYIITAALVVLYLIFWLLLFKKETMSVKIMLAVLPTAIFIEMGILSGRVLLVLFGIVFGAAHIYLTGKKNCR